MNKPRRPWVAGLLTIATPGLGQLYAGSPLAAVIASIAEFGGLTLAVLILLQLQSSPADVLLPLLMWITILSSIIVDAVRRARRHADGYELRAYNRWYIYVGVYLLTSYGVVLPLVGAIHKHAEAFRVPSGSMEPTLLIGDFLMVATDEETRRSSGLGSIVVFQSIEEPELKVIKRIVGIPGDTLAMKEGALWRNNRLVTEPYSQHTDSKRSEDPVYRAKMRAWQLPHLAGPAPDTYQPDLQDWGPLLVSPDSVFMLGDNRDHSYDSRYTGLIPIANVRGKPRVIYYSRAAADNDSAAHFRWSRFGLRFDERE